MYDFKLLFFTVIWFRGEKRHRPHGGLLHSLLTAKDILLLHLLNGLLLVFSLLLSIRARLGLALQDLLTVLVQL